MSATVIVKVIAKPGHAADMRGLLEELIARDEDNEDFLSSVMYVQVENPHEFLILEEWTSHQAHRQHVDRFREAGYFDRVHQIIEPGSGAKDYKEVPFEPA